MDRYLLSGAIALLILEVTLFLAGLGIVDVPFWKSTLHKENTQQIGKVIWTRESVRKKGKNSLVWEESGKQDSINSYDSVLTLKNSSAKLKLRGDINIDLHENTLVVLEPPRKSSENRFRIQFERGDFRSKNPTQTLKLGSGKWTLEAKQGSDLSLKSLSNGEVEVEVSEGEVQLKNKDSHESKTITDGFRVQIDDSKVIQEKQLVEDLSWSTQNPLRVYAHEFPVIQNLQWKGQAKSLRLYKPGQKMEYVSVSESSTNQTIEFYPGTWSLSLENENQSSSSLLVQVFPAPKISHLSPLPRTRVRSDDVVNFSWLGIREAKSYKLIVQNQIVDSLETLTKTSIKDLGLLHWQVIGVDEDGFEIPGFYHYPIYNVTNPLEAPQLKRPGLRAPSSEDEEGDKYNKGKGKNKNKNKNKNESKSKNKSKKSQSIQPKKKSAQVLLKIKKHLVQLSQLILPEADAAPDSYDRAIVFSWYPVADADHYVIEISESADFRSPVLTQKVKETEFFWKNFATNVYYYRVAAGREDGRMGLFSAPERVDLSQLNEGDSKELQPGVRYQVSEPKPNVKKESKKPISKDVKQKNAATKTQDNKENKTVLKSEPEIGPKADRAEKSPAPKIPKENLNLSGNLWWSFAYAVIEHENSQNVKATNNGWQYLNFGLNLNIPLKKSGRLIWLNKVSQTAWKRKSTGAYPFQEDFDKLEYFTGLLWTKTTVPIGITYEMIPLAERSGNESIKLENQSFFGVATQLDTGLSDLWNSRHLLALSYGDGIVLFRTDNYGYVDMDFWGQKSMSAGIELNVRYGMGDSDQQMLGSYLGIRLDLNF